MEMYRWDVNDLDPLLSVRQTAAVLDTGQTKHANTCALRSSSR